MKIMSKEKSEEDEERIRVGNYSMSSDNNKSEGN